MQIIVPPSGPIDAKLVIIGEAPGEQEERYRKPFVGPSGDRLDSILAQNGLDRRQVRVTNLLKWRPPKNDITQIDKPTLAAAKTALRAELRELKGAQLYVPLGNYALWAVADAMDITKRRGAPCKAWDGRIALPTLHPAATFRMDSWLPLLYLDIARVAEALCIIGSGKPLIPTRDIITIEDPADPRCWAIITQLLAEGQPITFDIETARDGTRISCISFANSTEWGVSMVLGQPNVRQANTLLTSPLPKIGQNVFFDAITLEHLLGIRTSNIWIDTMILHHTLDPELPHGLGFISSQYTWEPYFKDEGKGLWSDKAEHAKTPLEQQLRYNAKDSIITHEVAKKMLSELAEDPPLEALFHKQIMRVWYALYHMTLRGVSINTAAKDRYAEILSADINQTQRLLNSWAGRDLNIDSPKQMREHFIATLKLRGTISHKTGSLSFDEDAINKMAERYPDLPCWPWIRALREKQKYLRTYAEAKVDPDNRIRTSYSQTTVTGRLSSRKVPWNAGMNLQNIPRGTTDGGAARRMFIADPGHILIEADYSQIEDRFVALISDCKAKQAIFNSGLNSHLATGRMLFGREISKDGTEYDLAKRVSHLSNYKGKAAKISEACNVPLRQAIDAQIAYFRVFPEILAWHDAVNASLKSDGILTTPFGRKRRFYGRRDDDLWRTAVAHEPQSTTADLTNRSLWLVWAVGLDVLMQIHDSIVIQAPEDDWHIAAAQMLQIMTLPLQVGNEVVSIPVDVKIGQAWGDLRKVNTTWLASLTTGLDFSPIKDEIVNLPF